MVDACLHLLKNPDASVDDLIEIIPAPDFPTAGIIYGLSGVRDGYRTGRGRVVMRAKVHFEDIDKGNRQSIIVDELPYQVNKKTLQERMAELVHEKKIEGISHIQDESDKSGMRLVIELKRGEVPEVVLNNLYKQTQLQDTFGINMVALIDGQPKLCNSSLMMTDTRSGLAKMSSKSSMTDMTSLYSSTILSCSSPVKRCKRMFNISVVWASLKRYKPSFCIPNSRSMPLGR